MKLVKDADGRRSTLNRQSSRLSMKGSNDENRKSRTSQVIKETKEPPNHTPTFFRPIGLFGVSSKPTPETFDTQKSTSLLTSKTWQQQKEVSTPRCPHSIRLLCNKVWLSCEEGVHVYSNTLEPQRLVKCPGMHGVRDVAMLSNGELVVASLRGLFHINDDGILINMIDTGAFSSVQIVNDTVYTARKTCGSLLVYSHTGTTWSQTNHRRLPCGKMKIVTICANKDSIVVCCCNKNKLYRYSIELELVEVLRKETPNGDFIWPKCPFICDEDEEGGYIIADHNHDLLRVLDTDRKWHDVTLEPAVTQPRSAVRYCNMLFVTSWTEDKLYMYT